MFFYSRARFFLAKYRKMIVYFLFILLWTDCSKIALPVVRCPASFFLFNLKKKSDAHARPGGVVMVMINQIHPSMVHYFTFVGWTSRRKSRRKKNKNKKKQNFRGGKYFFLLSHQKSLCLCLSASRSLYFENKELPLNRYIAPATMTPATSNVCTVLVSSFW